MGTRLRFLAVVVGLVCLVLGGCIRPSVHDVGEGTIRISVTPSAAERDGISAKVIPAAATKVRVRVWHPQSGFNAVATVVLGTASEPVDIAVPEDTDYVVDAVAYYLGGGAAYALTGSRATRVIVAADEVSTVTLSLRPWTAEVSAPDTVKPGDSFSVKVVATDAGGLITLETFRSATLYASLTSYQTSSSTLPSGLTTPGLVFDDRMTFSLTAPSVTKTSTLYLSALIRFSDNWSDSSLVASERPVYLELPNRYMNVPIHQLTVEPAAGGIVVDISSAEP
ncbi:MAG: hypothetical protein NTY63_08705 [Candidatus Bipolaricaulota bacterium]|nr:hypothetical protein [Candidatus Bipolaricaulota bacterium]